MKTEFVRYIGNAFLNHNGVEMRVNPETGRCILRHEKGMRHSGISKSFGSRAEAEEWIDQLRDPESVNHHDAGLLQRVLCEMGVGGFAAEDTLA